MYRTLHEEIRGICKESGYPQKWPRHGSCPCCTDSRISFYFRKIDMHYWVCKKCQFVFANPYPGDLIMERIYNAGYYPAVRKYIEIPRALADLEEVSQSMADCHYRDIIDLVGKHTIVGKWLDVGGGIGAFLHQVRKQAPDYTLFLNETNRDSVQFAETFYKLQVLPVGPEQLLQNHQGFDIISMLSVLEHINRPFEFLESYLKLLVPNGLLILSVPTYTRFNRLFSRQHSHNVIPPYHLNLFNRHNLSFLLKRFKDLGNIQIVYSGDSAFKFSHLARWSEFEDIRIPMQNTLKQEFIYHKKAGFVEEVLFRGLGRLDKIFSPLFAKLDGRIFMNIVARKDNEKS